MTNKVDQLADILHKLVFEMYDNGMFNSKQLEYYRTLIYDVKELENA